MRTVEVRHSAHPTCVGLAALAASTLGCPAVQDPPEGDDRSVRVLADGRQVASVYVGDAPRSSEWVSAMAARLAASVNDGGFGGQGTVEALHAAHGVARYDAERIAGARRAARMRRRAAAAGTTPTAGTDDDRGGE